MAVKVELVAPLIAVPLGGEPVNHWNVGAGLLPSAVAKRLTVVPGVTFDWFADAETCEVGTHGGCCTVMVTDVALF